MAATLIGFSVIAASAQTEEEVSALLAEALALPDWDTVFTATGGAGYKDNVFLSATAPQGSPYVSGSGEVFVMRLAPTGPRVTVFANAEAWHYSAEEVDYNEYTSFNQVSLEGPIKGELQGSFAARYFYQDQVLDVSVTETNRQATPVLGHTFSAEPGLRLGLPGHNSIALSTPVTRQLLESPLDNYWQGGLVVALGHDYRWDSSVTLNYEPLWRAYDTDPARTSTGDAIPDSERQSFQQDLRLVWRHHWDEAEHWRTVLTVGGRQNAENGGGFSDYVRGLVSGRIEYRVRGWRCSAEGRLAHYDYRNQTVTGSSTEKRRRTETGVFLEVEKRLSKRVAWAVRYEHETVGSNDPLESYNVNTVGTTLSVEF